MFCCFAYNTNNIIIKKFFFFYIAEPISFLDIKHFNSLHFEKVQENLVSGPMSIPYTKYGLNMLYISKIINLLIYKTNKTINAKRGVF